MDFAYQYPFGQSIWNDFDDGTTPRYRDHVFAYPTSNGVIDTIQWEGWREGVDDTRYVATLIKKEGSDTTAKTIVSAGLSNNENMTTIRKKVIEQILPTGQPTPVYPSLELNGAWIPQYPAVTVFFGIVALFGVAVYAMRFWRR
jgi:hypothetical protein